jgi:hypothetical protein
MMSPTTCIQGTKCEQTIHKKYGRNCGSIHKTVTCNKENRMFSLTTVNDQYVYMLHF